MDGNNKNRVSCQQNSHVRRLDPSMFSLQDNDLLVSVQNKWSH
jgi:hypothetical protein